MYVFRGSSRRDSYEYRYSFNRFKKGEWRLALFDRRFESFRIDLVDHYAVRVFLTKIRNWQT